MRRYITIVQYIDITTGEIVDNKGIKNRNFRELKKSETFKFNKENGTNERTIKHYGNLGSAGEGDSQLRLW